MDRRADRRAAPRHRLLYRTAKVRTESREFLCLLCNVSATGFTIRLLGDLAIEPDCEIELSNGIAHKAELVWQHERMAGFSFVSPIDVNLSLSLVHEFEPRAIRLTVSRPVKVSGDIGGTAELVDISIGGAKLHGLERAQTGQHVQVDLMGIGQIAATVRWTRTGVLGLMFQDPLKFDQLARWSLS